MWQELREELHPQGFELVTVGLDTLGAEGCRRFIEAAKPKHPSLVDPHHLLARLFGVVNIPSSVWIDEAGTIVRPAEAAPVPRSDRMPRLGSGSGISGRFGEMLDEAAKIPADTDAYHRALRDWVEKGAASRFALSPEEVVERSRPRDADVSLGHAHFELASHLELEGHHDAAIRHFREAHRLVPDSWSYRRQAWSLERGAEGPFARFWQGPSEDDPEAWPYEGDWLSDIRQEGPENYVERFVP